MRRIMPLRSFPMLMMLLLCSCVGSEEEPGTADPGGGKADEFVANEQVSCSSLGEENNTYDYDATSSPRQVCEGVAAAVAGDSCSSLGEENNTYDYEATSSPRQVCEGVTAAMAGDSCSSLGEENNTYDYDATSSARQICEGVAAAIAGDRCSSLGEENNTYDYDATSSARQVCEGVTAAMAGDRCSSLGEENNSLRLRRYEQRAPDLRRVQRGHLFLLACSVQVGLERARRESKTMPEKN